LRKGGGRSIRVGKKHPLVETSSNRAKEKPAGKEYKADSLGN